MADTRRRLLTPAHLAWKLWGRDPGQERAARRRFDDELGVPRCPHCGYTLVARINRAGPYFHCLCAQR